MYGMLSISFLFSGVTMVAACETTDLPKAERHAAVSFPKDAIVEPFAPDVRFTYASGRLRQDIANGGPTPQAYKGLVGVLCSCSSSEVAAQILSMPPSSVYPMDLISRAEELRCGGAIVAQEYLVSGTVAMSIGRDPVVWENAPDASGRCMPRSLDGAEARARLESAASRSILVMLRARARLGTDKLDQEIRTLAGALCLERPQPIPSDAPIEAMFPLQHLETAVDAVCTGFRLVSRTTVYGILDDQ
jgi:hypothetical protein